MRWFKHLTASNRDENLRRIQDEFGLEGYGLYWIILETIAEKLDKSDCTSMQLSIQNWKKITGVSAKKLRSFLVFAQELKIFSVEISQNIITIGCSKLLKYRDEYTSRKV